MKGGPANERATGKGGIPSLLAVGHARPALPEHDRWPETGDTYAGFPELNPELAVSLV